MGKYLEQLVKREIGCKVRSIELNLMQRCASHLSSKTDIDESFAVGAFGTNQALAGITGKMAVICRNQTDEKYEPLYRCEEIEKCANHERLVPKEWHNLADPAVQKEIVSYILPLIRGEGKRFADEYGNPDYIDWLRFSNAEGS